MSEPESYTAAQASDPSTPGQVLADIAALRPDLRPAVAANPSAYPGLLEWLGSLGEPAVDAAIAARQPVAAAPQPQYQQPPARPATAPSTSLPPQGQYGAPATAAPYGQVPPAGYGYAGTPPAKKSHTALWVILGVVGLLIVLAIVAVVLVVNRVKDVIEDVGVYGTDSQLDALWDRCANEDWQACDDLFIQSPVDSVYEDFGDTCGNRQASGTGVYCTEAFGADTSGQDDSAGEPFTYGDDAYLDGLWDACEGGDMQSCDDLFFDSPFDSEYEEFGDTCGGRTEGGPSCVG